MEAKSRADKEYERITLEDDVFDRFFAACLESDNTPNQALQDAAEFALKGVLESKAPWE